MIFSISVTPLDLSNRSAVTQYGQTAVLYITTLAMMILSALKNELQKHLPQINTDEHRFFRSLSVFICVYLRQKKP